MGFYHCFFISAKHYKNRGFMRKVDHRLHSGRSYLMVVEHRLEIILLNQATTRSRLTL